MNWDFRFTEDATKDLRKLGPGAAKAILHFLRSKIFGCENPRAFGAPLRANLKGFWKYRIGDYRIICQLQNEVCLVVVVKAGHRRNVYNE